MVMDAISLGRYSKCKAGKDATYPQLIGSTYPSALRASPLHRGELADYRTIRRQKMSCLGSCRGAIEVDSLPMDGV